MSKHVDLTISISSLDSIKKYFVINVNKFNIEIIKKKLQKFPRLDHYCIKKKDIVSLLNLIEKEHKNILKYQYIVIKWNYPIIVIKQQNYTSKFAAEISLINYVNDSYGKNKFFVLRNNQLSKMVGISYLLGFLTFGSLIIFRLIFGRLNS